MTTENNQRVRQARKAAVYRAKLRSDPERLARHRAHHTAYLRNRRAADPNYARRRVAGYRAKVNADPEKRALYRAGRTAYMKKWRAENLDKWNAIQQRTFQKMRDDPIRLAKFLQQAAKRRRKWRANNKTADAEYRLKVSLAKLKIDRPTYIKLLERQSGRCAICNVPPSSTVPLCIDHDHETGQVRGLLCTKCNVGIGVLGDTAEHLRKALAYLLTWNSERTATAIHA
jgi:hypothetical protein